MTKKRLFNFQEDNSAKFWEISQSAETVTIRYGKHGSTGQNQSKTFVDSASASQHVQKLIAEKLSQGFIELGATVAIPSDLGSRPSNKLVPQVKASSSKATTILDPARDPAASKENLMALFGKDDATNRLLAKHPNASSDLLEKLSHSIDKATRRAVTLNPNTPPEVFVRLGQHFPKEFLANHALDLLLLVNPALMEEVPEAMLVRLLKQDTCPESLLAWAGANSSKKIQLAVSMNPRTPAHILHKLQESQHVDVVSDLKYRQETFGFVESEAVFQKEVQNRLGALTISEATEAWSKKDIGLVQYHLLNVLVQQAIAGADFLPVLSTGNIPKASLDDLSRSHDLEILAAVAQNPNTSPSALVFLGSNAKDWTVLDSIAKNPNTPGPILLELANKSPYFKGVVAQNPGLSELEHEFFANDPDVSRNYAANPRLSPSRLEIFAKSQDPSLCIGAALNPSSNVSTLKELAKDKKYWQYLVKNPSTDSETISLIASDPPPDSLGSIAYHANTDPVILEKIISSGPFHVDVLTINVADRNKNISQARLDVLFDSGQYDLVASNQSTPTTTLDRIAKLKRKSTFFYLARNSNSSLELLKSLSTSKDELVRGGVASNNSCPASNLDFLSQDQSAYVRWRVLANSNITESLRQSVMCSLTTKPDLSLDDWFARQLKLASPEVKAAVNDCNIFYYQGKDPNGRALSKLDIGKVMALCSGPYVAPERIARLSVSTDWLIRAAVARNSATPLNLINKLAKDKHPVVAALAKINIELDASLRNYRPFPIENSIKKIALNKDEKAASLEEVVVGSKVNHAKFGQGVVLVCEGTGPDIRAQVVFSNKQVKWLALPVAKLTVINS